MLSKRTRTILLAALALAWPAATAPAVAGGPISDMMARYRTHRQMKIPPIEKPFTGKSVKDISPSSLAGRFQKRFTTKRPSGTSITSRGGLFGSRDEGVSRTSR